MTARPVTSVVLTFSKSPCKSPKETLCLPAQGKDVQETVVALEETLHGRGLLLDVESETDHMMVRFHNLLDKKFLGTITTQESKELASLTQWRDEVKNTYYRELNARDTKSG